MNAKHLAWALVFLAFLSKVSFTFTGLVPTQLGFLLFQGGIHPYLNVLLNFLLGFALLAILKFRGGGLPKLTGFHPFYFRFAIGTLIVLWIQHFLQVLNGQEGSVPLIVITMACTTFLIYFFGLLLPKLIPGSEFVRGIGQICTAICLASLLAYFLGMPGLYKGARFVGVLKHIPYMVTCSTAGFLFNLGQWNHRFSLRKHFGFGLMQLAMLYCLFLTGTRSSLVAVALGALLYFLAYKTESQKFRMARFLSVWVGLVAVVLFGGMAYELARDIATGKAAIGQRAPQDGVGDRMEEVSRGLQMLEKSPHFGLGLLSKFNSSDGEEVVDNYNSFQDPHNLFISSAVVGGWPFGLWVLGGFIALGLGTIAMIRRRTMPYLVVAIYLLSHMPILAIYHMHLSLGGLADRLYWLSFAYLGLGLGPKINASAPASKEPSPS